MKKIFLFAALCCITMAQAETTYNSGVFILNEDWYGHNNSTINHLSHTGQFTYRILQAANQDTHFSLGCTSQFGAIYGDRFYIISKQEQDPGEGSNSQWRGGRVVVADAKTLKVIYSIPTILEIDGKSAADGRAFVGVDETKGYIGTSNGIFILDLASGKIGKRIAGTENPLVKGGENNSDGTSYAGLPAGSTVKDSNGADVEVAGVIWKTTDALTLKTTTEAVEVGGVKFATLEEAFAAAKNGDTITLLSDVEMTETIKVTDGKKITLALNGFNVTITATGKFIRVCNAELTSLQ